MSLGAKNVFQQPRLHGMSVGHVACGCAFPYYSSAVSVPPPNWVVLKLRKLAGEGLQKFEKVDPVSH